MPCSISERLAAGSLYDILSEARDAFQKEPGGLLLTVDHLTNVQIVLVPVSVVCKSQIACMSTTCTGRRRIKKIVPFMLAVRAILLMLLCPLHPACEYPVKATRAAGPHYRN